MRILVAWGSKHGGTAGIGRVLAEEFERHGIDVTPQPARDVRDISGFDAVIIGSSLYANWWHRDARRFIGRHEAALRRVPVWFFSSGPLDDSATREVIPPPARVKALMECIGALGHVTFGGRLDPNVKGFPAAAMAKEHAGDWRNPEHIRAWADNLARALPTARPAPAASPPGGSLARLVAYGVVGWALCAGTMAGLLAITSTRTATILHTIAAPLLFVAVSWLYFRPRGARAPLPTALAVAGIVVLLDAAVVAGALQRSAALFSSFSGFWLPIALIFLVTWVTGMIASMLPFPERSTPPPASPHEGADHFPASRFNLPNRTPR